ncbi:MAG: ATP synthase F1 subunit epsilon [Rickettsiaceae bacterium]|jgi:F-type H+-transporting ATPase subunit epsilon|nr:ATP synthase F1 subunit epsilon [Rickettsiaceae bacterium]
MNNTILVKITMPSETIFEGEAKMVNIPGSDGIFGVLPGHAKLIAKITIGCISVFLEDHEKKFFIYDGIAQITPLEVNIVSEFAVDLEGQNKNEILSKITNLNTEREQAQENSLEAKLLENAITKYNSLLDFMGN